MVGGGKTEAKIHPGSLAVGELQCVSSVVTYVGNSDHHGRVRPKRCNGITHLGQGNTSKSAGPLHGKYDTTHIIHNVQTNHVCVK